MDLSLVARFYAGVGIIVAVWVAVFAGWAFLPTLLRESRAWCRAAFAPPPPQNVFNIADRRRRVELR